jgi:CheY-like chemotaxis protein/HPt (histidine-containing phosphotransfer) domain-containing protein
VECERAENDDELRKKLQYKDYTFLFVSHSLLENAKAIMKEIISKTKIVVLTEFGDATADMNLDILAMPVHSISVANVLNGVSGNFSYSMNENFAARFIAPNARILIVDDISTNLKVAEGLMLPYKMHVDLRLSGSAAIEAVKKNLYDLVLMDHMMPEMDGVETTKLIREMGSENPHYINLPIVALTANAISGTKEMFLSNGFNDFLSKPIDIIKLNAILAKWLPKEKQEKLTAKVVDAGDLETTEIEIAGVDIKKGISITGGTLKSYMQILAVFHRDGRQKMNEIRNSLEMNNYPLYTTYVHALKSASASIGALDLSETAKSLEMAGKQGDFAYIKLHNSSFLMALEILLNNISKALLADKNNRQKGSIDFETLKSELSKLKEAVGIYDFDVINKVANFLQTFVQDADVGADIENILQKILIGEYEEIIPMIDILMGEIQIFQQN